MLSDNIETIETYLVNRAYSESITPAWLRIKSALEPVQQPITKGKTPAAPTRYAEIAAEMIALAESNKAQCYNHHNSKLREWARQLLLP